MLGPNMLYQNDKQETPLTRGLTKVALVSAFASVTWGLDIDLEVYFCFFGASMMHMIISVSSPAWKQRLEAYAHFAMNLIPHMQIFCISSEILQLPYLHHMNCIFTFYMYIYSPRCTQSGHATSRMCGHWLVPSRMTWSSLERSSNQSRRRASLGANLCTILHCFPLQNRSPMDPCSPGSHSIVGFLSRDTIAQWV